MENIIPEKLLGRFYNISVLIIFFIIFMVIGFGLILNLVILSIFSAKIGGYLLLLFFLFWVISFSILFQKYVI